MPLSSQGKFNIVVDLLKAYLSSGNPTNPGYIDLAADKIIAAVKAAEQFSEEG